MQKNVTRFLSRVLVLLMTLQLVSVGPVFAASAYADDDAEQQEPAEIVEETAEEPAEEPAEEAAIEEADVQEAEETITIHSGSALIPSGTDAAAVTAILNAALIDNYDSSKDYSSVEWEYYCEGKSVVQSKNSAWGSIAGFKSETGKYIKTTYTHPALADNENGSYQVRIKGTSEEVALYKVAKYNSSVAFPESFNVSLIFNDDGSVDYDAIRAYIREQLVTEPADMDRSAITVEYYAPDSLTGKSADWMPLEGGKGTILSYVAMTAGEQKIKVDFAGNDSYYSCTNEITVTVGEGRSESAIALKDDASFKLIYNDDLTVNYDEVRALIFAQFETTPELSVNDVAIEYYATATTGAVGSLGHNWAPIEGGKVDALTYPAMTAGEQTIRISYAGSKDYLGFSKEFTVNVGTGREDAVLAFAENPSFKLSYNEDITADYDAAYQAVYELLETKIPETISLEDLTIEYYATATTGAVGDLGRAWVPLEGGKANGLTYPGIDEGTQRIRVSYAGSREYNPASVEAEVEVLGRPAVNVTLNEAPYEVGFVFADAENYDYAATTKAIFDAVVASTEPELAYDDFTVEYNASQTGLTEQFRPIDGDNGIYKAFADGTWTIRFSWNGTREYKGGSFTVEVTVTDNRIASNIVYVDGAAITYNMDASAMKQAIFDNVIDWTNSTLPAKETLSVDDFTFEYKAKYYTTGEDGVEVSIESLNVWVPIEGKAYEVLGQTLGMIPQMGAADSQQLRITYRGSSEYRPQKNVEGTLKVNKADVKVKVHSASIHAGEAIPSGFVTTDPADKFDIYTIYAGITSNVTTSIYVDLPARFQNETLLKVVDPVVEKITGKTLSAMLNDGVTVGELKELLNATEIIDMLNKIGIDTGTFGQIITVLDKLPGVFDNLTVAFGTPKHAGFYTVTAVTDNQNYNTGVGVGALVVLKNTKGTKLNWNQPISGKLTQAEAAEMNWGVYLTLNGEKVDTDNLHFLYSGFTSKWKPYSSTTTPPTEPGRYVVTVVTLGGDYLAAPITRTFQITK